MSWLILLVLFALGAPAWLVLAGFVWAMLFLPRSQKEERDV